MKKTIGLLLLVTSSAFLSVNTANATSNSQSDKLSVGDYYQGGVIYWLEPKRSEQHGLIIDIKDAPDAKGYAWDTTPPSKTGATDNKPFGGKTNTQTIIAAIDAKRAQAASVCASSHNQDYSDWYLPAKEELELILGKGKITANIIKTAKAHGGHTFNHTPYWSSTEFHVNSAWNVTGGSATQASTYKKNILLSVRCIRSF